jgi:DNA polymerase-3 subunit delta
MPKNQQPTTNDQKPITSNQQPKFYLLHGDDDMAIEEAVKQLRAGMGTGPNAEMNISDYQGEEVSVPKVLNDVRSFPFLADKRLVIVKGFVAYLMRTNAGKDQLDALIEAVPNLPNHARLVLVEREKLKSNLKIVTAANKHGYCREFSVPKDATGWIMNRAKSEYDAVIEPQAAAALASVIGTDLRAADNELVKLVSYVNGERAINEKDVATLTAYVAEANVFDMVDALATGNGKIALSLMHQSLEQDPSDPGFRLFSLIARQFRLLLLAREYLDTGGSSNNNAIAQVLGIHPFPAGKVAVQSRRFNVPQLEKIYRRVQQYDVEMKTGRIKPRLALELLVASLAQG